MKAGLKSDHSDETHTPHAIRQNPSDTIHVLPEGLRVRRRCSSNDTADTYSTAYSGGHRKMTEPVLCEQADTSDSPPTIFFP